MTKPGRFWGTFVGVVLGFGGSVDLWANYNDVPGDTLSERIRALGIPDWLLATLLGGTAAELYVHLKQRPNERRTR